VETELALGEGLLQSVNELATKDPSQDLAGKKEAGMGGEPAAVVGGESSGGNDAMDVGMGLQPLTLQVWRTLKKPISVLRCLGSRATSSTEEQAVEDLLVLQGEGRQVVRESEDEVGVRGGQDFPAARLDPSVAGVGLAPGAVSIAAAVVRDDAMPAMGALIEMST
jgi:hypothetical protein